MARRQRGQERAKSGRKNDGLALQFFRTSVLILLAAILLAQDPDDKTQHELTASAQAGKKEFQQTCAFCHGPDARGASAPDLIRSSL
ncbi:MAG: cytochrome c, partial [Acidobacteriaceae bacterium]|nr:cytochrome c [Acidobacteriaceae bacterium]